MQHIPGPPAPLESPPARRFPSPQMGRRARDSQSESIPPAECTPPTDVGQFSETSEKLFIKAIPSPCGAPPSIWPSINVGLISASCIVSGRDPDTRTIPGSRVPTYQSCRHMCARIRKPPSGFSLPILLMQTGNQIKNWPRSSSRIRCRPEAIDQALSGCLFQPSCTVTPFSWN